MITPGGTSMTTQGTRPELSRTAGHAPGNTARTPESTAAIVSAFQAEADGSRHLDLLEADPAPTWHRRHRHGVHTLCVPDSSLSREQSAAMLAFRIANYVRVGFIDTDRLADLLEAGAPLGVTGPGDVHIVALTEQGKILCTAILRTLDGPDDTIRLSDTDRPFFPVELVHGHGVFNGLRVLSDLPVARIRELGGFVKSKLPEAPQLTIRATMEVGVALMTTLATTPMTLHVDALIGDLDPAVAKANLEYFGGRLVVLSTSSHQAPPGSYLAPRYAEHDVHPFAMLIRDSMPNLDRLNEIDQGLDLPDAQALRELVRLRDVLELSDWSTLTPEGRAGLLRSPGGSEAGDEISAIAARLREAIPLLQQLTDTQLASLATSVEEVVMPAGATVIRQGETDDAMFMISSGEAVVLLDDGSPEARTVGEFGPGDCFGEVAALLGRPRTATVIARTELGLWRLSGQDYRKHLEQSPVERELSRTAMRRVLGRAE
jgi:hypothetical protein